MRSLLTSSKYELLLKRIEPKIPWPLPPGCDWFVYFTRCSWKYKKINVAFCKHKIKILKIFLIHSKVFNFAFHLNMFSHCTCQFHYKRVATPLRRRLRNSWQLRPNSPQFCFSPFVCCSFSLLFFLVCVYALLHRYVYVIFSGQQIGSPPRNDRLLRAYGSYYFLRL